MERMTTKIKANNFRMMTTLDISLRTFKPNSMHRASRHFKKKFKLTPKDFQKIKRDSYIWRD